MKRGIEYYHKRIKKHLQSKQHLDKGYVKPNILKKFRKK